MSHVTRNPSTKPDGRTTRFARKIVVHPKDIESKMLEEIAVGDITHEGPVIAVSIFQHTYTTPAGIFSVENQSDGIGVLARMSEDGMEVLLDAMTARGVL